MKLYPHQEKFLTNNPDHAILLRSLFDYKDGALYWKERHNNRIPPHKKAGYQEPRGYSNVSIQGKKYKLHRLVWEYHYGTIQKDKVVDHINRDKTDNRIENLRLVSVSENGHNRVKQTGIRKHSTAKKWQAYITINGKYNHLGNYGTRQEALRARRRAEQELRGVSTGNTTS